MFGAGNFVMQGNIKITGIPVDNMGKQSSDLIKARMQVERSVQLKTSSEAISTQSSGC